MRKSILRLAHVTGLLLSGAAMADGFVMLDHTDYEEQARLLRANGGRIHAQVTEMWNSYLYPSALGALDADGNVAAGFGQSGWLTSQDSRAVATDELLAADGSAYLLRAQNVESRDSSGALLATSATLYTGLATGTSGSKYAEVFARQPDGKFVIGGGYLNSAMGGADSTRWTVTRLSADLSAVDTSLGGGVVIIDLPHTGAYQPASVKSIHVLAGGKILMSGTNVNSVMPEILQTIIVRLNSDGSLDGTFGTNAQIVLPDSTGITRVDSAGRIYVAENDGTVTRLSSSGTADAGYAGGTGSAQLHVTGFELDSQERAVVFGWTTVSGVRRGHVSRLDTSGAPDAAFNTTGSATVTFPMALVATPLANLHSPLCVGTIQASDKPLLACDVVPAGDPNDLPLADLGIVRLTAAGVTDTTFGATQVDSDVFPDDYSFAIATAPFGTADVQSAPVTISGVNAPVRISAGGEISIGCNGTWQQSPALAQPGATFCVRGDAPVVANSSRNVTVNVSGRITDFRIETTALGADTIPDAFTFASQPGVAPGVLVTSAPITVQGITGHATLTVTNGYYSINCDGQIQGAPYNQVENGMTICASHYSSTTNGASDTTTVNIGGTIGTFTSTTVVDTTPDAFSFTARTGVALNTAQLSNTITVAGINDVTIISIVGGEYSVGCNSFTSAAGQVHNGDTVCIRHQSSGAASGTVTSTLTIGGVSASFSSTTVAASSGGGSSASSSSKGGGGGSVDPLWLGFTLGVLGLVARRRRQRSADKAV